VRDGCYHEELGARTRFGAAVSRVDDRRRTLTLEDGSALGYDRLLLATGARPVAPGIRDLEGPGVHFLWTLQQADRLFPELRPGRRMALIGSGFVSLQAGWAAHLRGLRLTVLEALPRILLARGEPAVEADLILVGAGVRPDLGFLQGTPPRPSGPRPWSRARWRAPTWPAGSGCTRAA